MEADQAIETLTPPPPAHDGEPQPTVEDPTAGGYCPGDYARFAARVAFDPETGCVRWTGTHDRNGYGLFYLAGATRTAHRAAWMLADRPLPKRDNTGRVLSLDHLCRTRDCVTLSDLQLVTHRENTLRGNTLAARYAARDHCSQGHRYTDTNTRIRVRDGRKVRVCRRCADERRSKAVAR